jgi:hypothetical protein
MDTGDGTQNRRTRRARAPEKDCTERPRPVRRQRIPVREVVARGREQFEEITGREIESVSALTKRDQGWELNVEVLELERVPQTTSVLATYLVRLHSDGEFVEYKRLRRYTRGQVDL